MDAELAGLGVECESLDTDDVTYVQKFLEDSVVHGLVLARAQLIAFDIDLDPSGRILQLEEGGGTHDASRHHPSGNAYVLHVAFLRIIVFGYAFCGSAYRVLRGWVGVDTDLTQFLHRIPALLFLLVERLCFHCTLLTCLFESQKYHIYFDSPQPI